MKIFRKKSNILLSKKVRTIFTFFCCWDVPTIFHLFLEMMWKILRKSPTPNKFQTIYIMFQKIIEKYGTVVIRDCSFIFHSSNFMKLWVTGQPKILNKQSTEQQIQQICICCYKNWNICFDIHCIFLTIPWLEFS